MEYVGAVCDRPRAHTVRPYNVNHGLFDQPEFSEPVDKCNRQWTTTVIASQCEHWRGKLPVRCQILHGFSTNLNL